MKVTAPQFYKSSLFPLLGIIIGPLWFSGIPAALLEFAKATLSGSATTSTSSLVYLEIYPTNKGADCYFCLTGFWSFLWFVAFCFLANQWQQTPAIKGASQGVDAARAAIAFSFFSIISWVRKTSSGLPLPRASSLAGSNSRVWLSNKLEHY